MITAIGIMCFCGWSLAIYSVGYVGGYEGKEKDLYKIEKDLQGFWKEGEYCSRSQL